MSEKQAENGNCFRLVPQILFQTEQIITSNGETIESAEIIRKDTPLIRLISSEYFEDTDEIIPSCTLVEGENSYLSDDRTVIFSKVDGFPTLTRSSNKGTDQYLLSITPLCHISSDKMMADISLFPPVKEGIELHSALIKEIFVENEIRFGVNTKHIQELLDTCKTKKCKILRQPVAKGLLPINGKDSFLRFAIEIGPLPGKILGNGKIDFRERKMFVGVKKGQTIATRISATAGTPGLNVCEEQIKQIPGRDLPVIVSDDASYDEETGIITASKNGILSMVGDNSIKVCSKQVISGNIDYSTGNIESHDSVEISGTILPGFKVVTHGDLLLGGNARSATIECRGNLVIKGGIRGQQSNVKVDGDADFSFMEKGRLRVKGNVIVRKQAYYTKIMVDGDIVCTEKSQIMSGELLCGGNMTLGSVGSANSPPALIAAGVSPGRYIRYLNLRSQLIDNNEELTLFLQRFGVTKKIQERKSLNETIRLLKREMRQLDLRPGAIKTERDQYINTISIKVQGTLFAGTEIQIGNATKTIHYDHRKVLFSLERKSGDLVETEL